MHNHTTQEPEQLRNAPRCQARAKATGKSCRCAAMRGKRVCHKHGGRSPGAPKGKANGNYRHGGETREAVALRREARHLLRELRADA